MYNYALFFIYFQLQIHLEFLDLSLLLSPSPKCPQLMEIFVKQPPKSVPRALDFKVAVAAYRSLVYKQRFQTTMLYLPFHNEVGSNIHLSIVLYKIKAL